jgi:uncharacterized protein YyaL (SSP411 family)
MRRTKRKRVEVYTYSAMDVLLADPVKPYPQEFQRHQLTRMYGGLRAIETSPAPSTDDWRVCSDAVNLMETLVNMGIVEDSSGLLSDAVTALAMAGKRYETNGVIRFDAKGIQSVRAVLEDYASVLAVLPHRTMMQCHRATELRIRKIVRGKLPSGNVEVISL